MDIEILKIFYRAAHAGSFRHSGVYLSPSAIGRKIAFLEDQLGISLFHRKRNGVELTEAGLRFLPRVERLLAEFEAATSELAMKDPSLSMVTVITPTVWASGFLIPTLDDYAKRYPNARMKLIGQDHMNAPTALDLVVHVFPYKDINTATENYKVGATRLKLFAHRDYARKVRLPKSLADLQEHPLISHTNKLYPFVNFAWYLERAKDEEDITLSPFLFTNNVIPFLINGFGIATLVENHPLVESGELVDVLPEVSGPDIDIFLTVHKTQKHHQQVLNFKELLTNKMSERNTLEGFK